MVTKKTIKKIDKKKYLEERPGFPCKEAQWKKGQSGNPKGRPPMLKVMKETFEKVATEMIKSKDGKVEMSRAEMLVKQAFGLAMKGNGTALNIVFDRLMGKVPLPIQNPDGSNLLAAFAGLDDDDLDRIEKECDSCIGSSENKGS